MAHMNILYINGWSINDQLTVATSFPSLNILSNSSAVESITFITPEVTKSTRTLKLKNTIHIGLPVNNSISGSLVRFFEELFFLCALIQICNKKKFDLIIARGAPSGGRASFLSFFLKIPFVVESFEPHSQYMIDSGVWTWFDPRFWVQRFWEYSAIKRASAIITVSNNFSNKLIRNGVETDRVFTTPCTVDLAKFAFNLNDRICVRAELSIPLDAIVGIYVGKFGGIYFDLADSFKIFSDAFRFLEKFYLVILSDVSREDINKIISVNGYKIDSKFIITKSIAHAQVSSYLSSADFGYALIKNGASKLYCSPVKIGEYWASGLPVIIPDGIGDDSAIIANSKLGVIIGDKDGWIYSERLLLILSNKTHRTDIFDLASKYRSSELITKTYKALGF